MNKNKNKTNLNKIISNKPPTALPTGYKKNMYNTCEGHSFVSNINIGAI